MNFSQKMSHDDTLVVIPIKKHQIFIHNYCSIILFSPKSVNKHKYMLNLWSFFHQNSKFQKFAFFNDKLCFCVVLSKIFHYFMVFIHTLRQRQRKINSLLMSQNTYFYIAQNS